MKAGEAIVITVTKYFVMRCDAESFAQAVGGGQDKKLLQEVTDFGWDPRTASMTVLRLAHQWDDKKIRDALEII